MKDYRPMILRVLTWPFRAVRDWMKRDVDLHAREVERDGEMW
jgi:hypothetical protein